MSNVDFHCKRCLERNPVQSFSLREVLIEPSVKLQCVLKVYYLCEKTFGVGRGFEEAA